MDHRQPPWWGGNRRANHRSPALLVGSCFPRGSRWRSGSSHSSLHAARVALHPVVGHAGGHLYTSGQIDELVRLVSSEPESSLAAPGPSWFPREKEADAAALEELWPRSRQSRARNPRAGSNPAPATSRFSRSAKAHRGGRTARSPPGHPRITDRAGDCPARYYPSARTTVTIQQGV
jgi:hypothetical protein